MVCLDVQFHYLVSMWLLHSSETYSQINRSFHSPPLLVSFFAFKLDEMFRVILQKLHLKFSRYLHLNWTSHPSELYFLYPFKYIAMKILTPTQNEMAPKRYPALISIHKMVPCKKLPPNSYNTVAHPSRANDCCIIRHMNNALPTRISNKVGAKKSCELCPTLMM